MKSTIPSCAVLLLLLLCLPQHASALRCRQWNRMAPAQKEATIQAMIDGLARNNSVRQTGINVVGTRRCMQSKAWLLYDEFDNACAQGAHQGLDVLDRTFKTFAWTCIR